jgi:hypothetical protein
LEAGSGVKKPFAAPRRASVGERKKFFPCEIFRSARAVFLNQLGEKKCLRRVARPVLFFYADSYSLLPS